ncbi:uncharacterized protein LOC119181654 [Rhipicephalus microplus]|uniref:uncharacterized protein LOC119181654 n=1 Tax=Rhipicephalus microplus TaxID=6941 RepID=UPI003F6CD67A
MIENADTVSELAVPSKGKDEDSASNILSAAGLEESSVALADSYRSPGTTGDDKSDNLCDPDNEALVICDSKNGSPALQHPADSSQAFEGKPSESRMTMAEPAGSLDIDAGVPENSLYALQSLTASMSSYQDCTYLAGQESSCASLQAFTAPQAGDAVSSRSHAAMEEVSPTSENNASNATGHNKSNHLDYSVLGRDDDRSQDSSGDHFKCETCCKSFMYFNFLTRHRRMHKAKTPYEYQTSSREIGKQEQLILHQHTHTGDRPGNRSPGSTEDDRSHNECDPDNEALTICDMDKKGSTGFQHPVDSSQAFEAKHSESCTTKDEPASTMGNDAGIPENASYALRSPTACIPSYHECTAQEEQNSSCMSLPVLTTLRAGDAVSSTSHAVMEKVSPTFVNNATSPGSTGDDRNDNLCDPENEAPVIFDSKNGSPALQHRVDSSQAFDAEPSGSRMTMDEAVGDLGNDAGSPGSTEDDRSHVSDLDNEAPTICDMNKERSPGLQHSVDSSQAFEGIPSRSCMIMDEPASTQDNDAGVPENSSYALHSPTACTPSCHECTELAGQDSSCTSFSAFTILQASDAVSSPSHTAMEEVSPTSVNNRTSPGSTGDDRNDNLCDTDNKAPVIFDSKNGSPALQHRVDSSQVFDAKPSGSRMTMDEAVGVLSNDAGSPGSTEDDRSHEFDLDYEAPTICDRSKEGSPGFQHPVDSSQAFEGKPSGSRITMDEPAGTLDNDAGVPQNSSYALQSPTACTSSYHECTELAGQDSRCTLLPASATLQAGDAVSSTTHTAMEEVSPSVNNATYATGHRKTNQLDDSVLGIDNDSSQDSSQDRYKCKTCGESFRYLNFLAKHRTLHTTETPFECKTSSEELRESEQLILHQHTHTGDGPCNYAVSDKSFKQIVHLVTPQCTDDEKKCYNLRKRQKLFSMVEKLAVHGSVHAEEKRYNCKACGKSFGRARLLVIHQRSHTDRPCNYAVCDKSFEQVAQLVTPQCTDDGKKRYNLRKREKSFGMMEKLAVHPSAHAEEKHYNCRACGESFGQSRLLVIHQRMHTGVKPYKCETCQQSFARSDKLSRHRLTHTAEKPYDCKTCGKSFVSSDKLFLHQRTHTGRKPYKCETCQQSFARSDKLSRHRLTHTAEKRYNCKTCGKSFVRSDKLFLHQRTHTGLKPYKCETCQQSFTRSDKLSRHRLTHTGEKRYNCKTCGKSFVRSDKLFLHQRTHTGLKPYKCKTCQQCFATSDKLSRHRLTHTGKKPHVCKICEKSFARSDKLFLHQRIHMDENLHTCTTCGKSFAQRASLVRHKCTHTGKTPHILEHAASHSLN